jgi:hypothetical protein
MAGFFDKFPLGTIDYRFLGIYRAGRYFPNILAQGVTVLFQQKNAGFLQQWNDGGRSGMRYEFHISGCTVIQSDIFSYEAEYTALMDGGAVVYGCGHVWLSIFLYKLMLFTSLLR